MSHANIADLPALYTAAGAHARLAPAEVISRAEQSVTVSFGVQQVEAECAVLDYQATSGDRVLVIGDAGWGYFVIGVLRTAQPRPKLNVSKSAHSQATIISVDSGDLELVAPGGAVRIVSASGVSAATGGPIDLNSSVAVRISLLGRAGGALRRLALTRRTLELQHDEVEVSAARLQLTADRSTLKTHTLDADVDSIGLKSRRISAKLGTLMSSVDNAYHTVAGLWQLVADRTRMVVSGTSHHKAARIYSKADDVKVKADKIHLG